MNRTLFRPEKWSLKKVQKTEIFPIVNNWNFLSIVFFSKSSQKRSFLDILEWTERFLDQKSEVYKKVQKTEIFPIVNNWNFLSIVFFGKSSQKRSILDVLDWKERFLDHKH